MMTGTTMTQATGGTRKFSGYHHVEQKTVWSHERPVPPTLSEQKKPSEVVKPRAPNPPSINQALITLQGE